MRWRRGGTHRQKYLKFPRINEMLQTIKESFFLTMMVPPRMEGITNNYINMIWYVSAVHCCSLFLRSLRMWKCVSDQLNCLPTISIQTDILNHFYFTRIKLNYIICFHYPFIRGFLCTFRTFWCNIVMKFWFELFDAHTQSTQIQLSWLEHQIKNPYAVKWSEHVSCLSLHPIYFFFSEALKNIEKVTKQKKMERKKNLYFVWTRMQKKYQVTPIIRSVAFIHSKAKCHNFQFLHVRYVFFEHKRTNERTKMSKGWQFPCSILECNIHSSDNKTWHKKREIKWRNIHKSISFHFNPSTEIIIEWIKSAKFTKKSSL